jgi:hypothetical protein
MIGRIFAQRVVVSFGQFFRKIQKQPYVICGLVFSMVKVMFSFLRKKRVALRFGLFFTNFNIWSPCLHFLALALEYI